jgi:hypothetical protein
MKNSIKLFASVALAAALGVVPALAQMHTTLKADVPFDFVVRGKVLPAGEYTISESSGSAAIIVRNTSTNESVAVITSFASKKAGDDDSKLVFHLAGDRYHLSTIRTGSEMYDRETIKSKAEQEAEGSGVVASIKAVRQ